MPTLPAPRYSPGQIALLPNLRPQDTVRIRTAYEKSLGFMRLQGWPTEVNSYFAWDTSARPLLILGRLYLWQPSPMWMADQYPWLASLFRLGLVARRSWYLKALNRKLHEAALGELSETEGKAVRFEHMAWMERDLRTIHARLGPLLTGWPDTDAHWLWQGRMGFTRPAMDWDGVEDVSLYRLLWTHYRPLDLLNDYERPRKDKEVCSDDDDLRRCVNPTHFEYAIQMKMAPSDRIRAGKRDDLNPNPRPVWYAANAVRDHQGNYYIRCPRDASHGHLGGRAQAEFHAGMQKGRGYCKECYFQLVRSRLRIPARTYAGRIEPPRSAAQLEAEAKRIQDTNKRMRKLEEDAERTVRLLADINPIDPDKLFQ